MPLQFNAFNITLLALLGLITIFLVVFFYYLKKHWLATKVVIPRTKNWVFLEIQMPKENTEDKQKPKTDEEKKNMIAIAEQLFTSLSQGGGEKGLFEAQDYISFEIACTDKKISFFINCPSHIQQLIEKQVQAQYPHAFIDKVRGYNPFQKGGEVEVTELQPTKKYVYPIRTYKNMETDPLNALTNAMSKLTENEGAAIQFIMSPAGEHWQHRPRHMALEIQQGKNPHIVERGIVHRAFREMVGGLGRGVAGKSLNRSDKDNQTRHDLTGRYSPINLTPMQQEIVKRLEEKASRPGFKTNIRIITSSNIPGNARLHMHNIVSSFLQYNMPPFNGFRMRKRKKADSLKDFIFRVFRDYGKKTILNTEELASLWHLPTPYLETPNIKWLQSKKAPPPINLPKEGILLGRNIYRGQETQVFMGRDDRRRHMYILGRTGSGKTELMKYMSVQDIKNGEGLCVIDPHGDFIEDILPHMPKERAEDVIFFEPFDTDRPMGLNMLEVRQRRRKRFCRPGNDLHFL